ncbi:hypothetical protein RAB80_006721 [Fusarium oxysporum f. sp. vasinfectum]|nr:hypothetical protein RAB80_006721 [Fusarium oxysporum f. sp. vasinfectum]
MNATIPVSPSLKWIISPRGCCHIGQSDTLHHPLARVGYYDSRDR